MHITDHAVQRYQERVEQIPAAEVVARLRSHGPTIDVAANFQCGTVICENGIRLKLKGKTIVTVVGKR